MPQRRLDIMGFVIATLFSLTALATETAAPTSDAAAAVLPAETATTNPKSMKTFAKAKKKKKKKRRSHVGAH